MKDMFYYIVTVKCGHVGRGKYCIKDLAIKANSKKDAAIIARKTPRVKHDWKDAIVNIKEVSKEDWDIQLDINNKDPFFVCKNIQEQRLLNLDMEIYLYEEPKYMVHSKEERRSRIEYKLKKREERYKTSYDY